MKRKAISFDDKTPMTGRAPGVPRSNRRQRHVVDPREQGPMLAGPHDDEPDDKKQKRRRDAIFAKRAAEGRTSRRELEDGGSTSQFD